MSEQAGSVSGGTAGGQIKTLAVRMSEDLRMQLDIIARLTGRSTTEEIRLALEHWIDRTKSDPAVLRKAEAVRAEIEREAQSRRNAIAAIFSTASPDEGSSPTPAPRTSSRRVKSSDD
jgi:predicted transcriptional regulator